MSEGPDLGLLLEGQKQMMSELRTFRDDMTVMSAIVMRLDTTMGAILTEIRAMHSQHGRLANRVRALETEKPRA